MGRPSSTPFTAMEDIGRHKRFFDDDCLNAIAWAWRDAVESDDRVTGFWFESDVRQDLLTPKRYFAFHVSIRDDAFDAYVASRIEFFSRAGELRKATVQDLVWPYSHTFPGRLKVSEDERRCTACWLTFSNGLKIDLIFERHSKIANIPRAFCRPLLQKVVEFETFRRHRIGQGSRVIHHRPIRPKGG